MILYDSLLTLAYPQGCHVCEKSVEKSRHGVVCHSCWRKTQIFRGDETICHKCGRFLREKPINVKTFCHQCDAHFYDIARSVGKYENGLSASIINLKREPTIPRHLHSLLTAAFSKMPFTEATRIIPVPLSRRRFVERGFNQASILAKVLVQNTGIKLDEKSLLRSKHSKIHRAGMDKKGRHLSVEGAFLVKREKLIRGENILLVDDVFTSGATVSSCAQALKKKGANKVFVLTVART